MDLTAAQLSTLKIAINAETDPTFVTARQALNWTGMVTFYNAASTFIVWRTSVSKSEMHANYVWSEMLLLTPAQNSAFALMLDEGFLNPSQSNVRTGMSAILASATATLTALTALAKRAATKGERVFAAGTGTNGSPGTLAVEGAVAERDLTLAMNS